MATKAELEAELAVLKKQLAERPVATSESKAEFSTDISAEVDDDSYSSGESLNIEKEIGEFLEDLDNVPHKQALLLALGVFALGYMLGRAR